MKKLRVNSVRLRLMLMFSVAFLILLGMLLLTTRLFFDQYYMSMNKQTMTMSMRTFTGSLMNGNGAELVVELKQNTGATVHIYTSDLKLMNQVVGQGANLPPARQGDQNQTQTQADQNQTLPPAQASQDQVPLTDTVKTVYDYLQTGQEIYFEVHEDDNGGLMVFGSLLPRGELLIMQKRMGLSEEASTLFFRFINTVSVVIYIVGILLIYVLTRFITNPIMKMKEITGKMANQDFSEKLEIKGGDEIQSLMASINDMADQLSTSIDNLNISNEQLEKELSKEKSLEKMRRQFVSDVSHELKNPLSMIIGYTDGLIQQIPKNERQKEEYYDIIMDEANRMERLVRDLLDLSGYESGAFTIEKEPFEINQLISDTLERLEMTLGHKEIHIDYDQNQDLVVNGDRLRIHQVLINLLSNSFKYVNDGGTIKISLNRDQDKVRFKVANTGPLIPEKDLEDIWNSFYQVNTENKGNGLGLAIVKSIIKLHNGTCCAYIEGGYNCFEFII